MANIILCLISGAGDRGTVYEDESNELGAVGGTGGLTGFVNATAPGKVLGLGAAGGR